ncbi:MAG TPA: MarR family transcriptional regulator [Micromonosporaceae bacterium]
MDEHRDGAHPDGEHHDGEHHDGEHVAANLAGVLEQLLRFMRQMATVGDLTMPAASTLASLVREGPQKLTELAHHQGVSQPGMTQLVTRLERDGLVRRTPGCDDRRVVLVEATDAGRDLLTRRRGERAASLGRLLDRLDDDDRVALRNALPALTRLVELAPTALPTGRRTAPTPGDTE